MGKMIYVVTAVHNRVDITRQFVNCIMGQTIIDDIRLLLVDDGSTDGTYEMVKSLMPRAVIIKGNGNLWWGGALHEAYKWLKDNAIDEDVVMFSNDDLHYENDYIERAVNILSGKHNVLLSGIGVDSDTDEVLDTPILWDFAKLRSIDKRLDGANCCSTRSLFFTVKTMKNVGGFHPVLLPHYASDYEWTMRAVRKGCSIVSSRDLTYKAFFSMTGNRVRNIKKLFSKRSNYNPIYRFNFILLTTPIELIPKALFTQTMRLVVREKKIDLYK